NLVALGRTLASQHIHLVIAVEVHFVSATTELLALSQISRDIALVSGRGHEGRKPVEPGDDVIFDFDRWHLAWPSDDCRVPKPAFHGLAFAARKRILSTVWPGEVLCTVVCAEGNDRVVIEAVVFHVLHHRADDVIQLRHPGFLDAPTVFRGAHAL